MANLTLARREAPPARGGLRDVHYKWLMFLPAVLVVCGLMLFPLLFTLGVSFTNWHLFFPEVQFVGLEMWKRPLQDIFLLQTLRNTVIFVLGTVPAQYVCGLIVALALNNISRGRSFFRVYFLMPMMISPVAIAYIIGRMMMHETFGPFNALLRLVGVGAVPWLSDSRWAMTSLVMIDVWHWTSFMILMLMAGLQSLPQEIYESAKIDGANPWQSFRLITFPLLAPITVTAILLRTIDAFKIIDIIKVVTGGGPGRSTESLTMAVLDIGVRGGDLAYGAVMGYILLASMLTASGLFVLATRRWVQNAV